MSRQQRSPSADASSPPASKEWSNVEDSEERRRIQNRVAQRRYRERVKKCSHQGKRRDKELSMTMPITESSLEQRSQISSHMNGPSLDHDVSTNVPWLLDPVRSQNFLDTLKMPSSCNADYHHMLREQDPQYSSNPASYEYSQTQFPSFNPLATPSPSNVGSTHDLNSYNSFTSTPSPNLLTQAEILNQDYNSFPTQPVYNKRRCEFQLPQRERGGSTKDPPRTREHTSPNSKNTKPASPKQQKLGAQKALGPVRKGGQKCSDSSKHAATPDDMSQELKKMCEKAQKEIMREAYQRGRSEAMASFEKQRSSLQIKAQELLESLIETVDFGVCLEVFLRDANLDRTLKRVKTHLQTLSQPGGGEFRMDEGSSNGDERGEMHGSDEEVFEEGEEGEDR